MKKENKKLAQEKRATERRHQETLRKLKKGLAYGIPALAAAALVIGIALNSGNSAEAANTSSKPGSSATQTGEYSIDTSLTIEDGDKINLDYVGTIDGVEFDGGNTYSSGTDLVIGSHTYIDDFEEQLIGRHPGDRVDVVVTFPEDFGDEKLNGKQALFECIINGIYR